MRWIIPFIIVQDTWNNCYGRRRVWPVRVYMVARKCNAEVNKHAPGAEFLQRFTMWPGTSRSWTPAGRGLHHVPLHDWLAGSCLSSLPHEAGSKQDWRRPEAQAAQSGSRACTPSPTSGLGLDLHKSAIGSKPSVPGTELRLPSYPMKTMLLYQCAMNALVCKPNWDQSTLPVFRVGIIPAFHRISQTACNMKIDFSCTK